MTLPAITGPALRRAALSLHALEADDRDWILHALPSSQSSVLRTLVSELQDLGIPAEELLPQQSAVQRANPRSRTLAPLTGAAARDLAGLLAMEPPRVRSVVLQAHSRSWGDCLRTPGDGGTPEGGQEADRAPALQEAVLAALRHRLETPGDAGSRRKRLWRKVVACFGAGAW